MKVISQLVASLAFILAIVIGVAGCSQSEPAVNVNTTPFKKAIKQYCRNKSMGMKVKEFVQLKAQGDTASGTAKMSEAGGNYGLSVKWKFKFKKENDEWKVLSCDR